MRIPQEIMAVVVMDDNPDLAALAAYSARARLPGVEEQRTGRNSRNPSACGPTQGQIPSSNEDWLLL